jgi:hypothetical protein
MRMIPTTKTTNTSAMARIDILLSYLTDRPDLFVGYLKGLNSYISGPGVVWCLTPWSAVFPQKSVVHLHTTRAMDWHTLLTEQHGYMSVSPDCDIYKRNGHTICLFPAHGDNPYDELERAPTTLDTVSYNGDEIFGKRLEDASQRVGYIMDHTKLTPVAQIFWTQQGRFQLLDKDQ